MLFSLVSFGCNRQRGGHWFSNRPCSLGATVVNNEPGAPLSCDIGPYPLQEDPRAQTGLPQELQMHSCPGEPGEEAAGMNLPALEYGKALADHGHIAFIEVT